MKFIDIVKAFLGSMRTENGLISVITDAKKLADNLEISPELFTEEVLMSPRKIKNSFPTRVKTSPKSLVENLLKKIFSSLSLSLP